MAQRALPLCFADMLADIESLVLDAADAADDDAVLRLAAGPAAPHAPTARSTGAGDAGEDAGRCDAAHAGAPVAPAAPTASDGAVAPPVSAARGPPTDDPLAAAEQLERTIRWLAGAGAARLSSLPLPASLEDQLDVPSIERRLAVLRAQDPPGG